MQDLVREDYEAGDHGTEPAADLYRREVKNQTGSQLAHCSRPHGLGTRRVRGRSVKGCLSVRFKFQLDGGPHLHWVSP